MNHHVYKSDESAYGRLTYWYFFAYCNCLLHNHLDITEFFPFVLFWSPMTRSNFGSSDINAFLLLWSQTKGKNWATGNMYGPVMDPQKPDRMSIEEGVNKVRIRFVFSNEPNSSSSPFQSPIVSKRRLTVLLESLMRCEDLKVVQGLVGWS